MGQIYGFQFQLNAQNCLAIPSLVHSNDSWFDGPDLYDGVGKLSLSVSCKTNSSHIPTCEFISCSLLVVLLWYDSLTSASTCPHLLPWLMESFATQQLAILKMPAGELSPNFLRTFLPWRVRMMQSFQWRKRASCPPDDTWHYLNTTSLVAQVVKNMPAMQETQV